MAILKKGSKGSDVKKLQVSLNKQGAKPKLAEDGDFGAKTEAAVKAFQKKAKLKVDGQVGPLTQAALKSGGPLPTMTVPDYSKRKAIISARRKDNLTNETEFLMIMTILDVLNSFFLKEVEKAQAATGANSKHWDVVNKLMDDIIKLQKDFETKRLSDPKGAGRIVSQCEAKHEQVESIAASKINPNLKIAIKHLKAAKMRYFKDANRIDKKIAAVMQRAQT